MQNEISGEMQKQVTENVPHRFAFAKRAARKAISGQSGAKISSSELTRALGVRVKTAQRSSNLGLASVKVMRGGSSTVSGITGIKKIK
ncbi:UNVERIFIED_CONTAM: hypothetical protein RF648_18625 [Kocuria sp. CPCC 205274]|uniref:Uncharacterized protein n=1 Tax=Herbiconiux daphne TaxID=2970914 RepID=A0ABT2H976_9MICO|nr:hypothetical protein [Herbiconiux daphne]MCS5736505.1 hypothetical protein [Herbiconiux daphne]